MKAVVDGVVLAEAPQEELIRIEGNWYFPPASLAADRFVPSDTPYTCPWKGVCQYFTVQGSDGDRKDLAWSYPTPYPSAFERVGKDFSGYVAFDPKVDIVA
ncbi:MAG TPA: DUF427 domain-containing protein [Microbacteriaceae bacterium]|nr:DUF427 domain-containing protein [Microbacteriaceae bacterium]